MVSFTLFFALGVWLLQQQETLPSLPAYWPLAALCLFLPRNARRDWQGLRLALVLASATLLGFSYAAWVADGRLSDTLPPEWQGRDIMLTGVVAEMPRAHERGQRFAFDVETVATAGAHVPRRILLATYAASQQAAGEVHAGERWRFTVRLKQPHGTSNPHGQDFEAWMLERKLGATGYVHPKGEKQRLAQGVDGYGIERLRESVRDRFLQKMGDAPYAGVLVALAVGDQASIPFAQWQLFTRTGINHLMSISGLHITMLSGLFFALTYWLWRRSARLTLHFPARKAAALAGLFVALGYAMLSGFEIPAQRTLFMLGTFAAMLLLSRNVAPSQMLASALFVVLLVDPWAVLAPGFWLSFGAVTLIFYITANRLGQPHWLPTYARVQWGMMVGLIPPLLALFQQLSLVSPLANALAIPLVSLVVVPLTLLAVLPPLDWLLPLAHWLLALCMEFLQWLDRLPVAVWVQHAPPAWSILLGVLGAAWVLAPRGFPLRWFGMILLLPMFMVVPQAPQADTARIVIFDVGQGLAVAVQTARHTLLFDTGPDYSGEADSGNRILVPAMRAMGFSRLDGLILSHADLDHVGGTASVLAALQPGWIKTSVSAAHPLLDGTGKVDPCRDGDAWNWDGVSFELLHPAAPAADDKKHDNNTSCVLRVGIGEQHLLLTGDIERAAEERLLAQHRDKLPASLLVAPHHGSKSSSTAEFVAAVAPAHVVFTAGYRNRFHHPHPATVRRYVQSGAKLWRSDEDGAILVEMDAARMSLEPYRRTHAHYWTHHPAE